MFQKFIINSGYLKIAKVEQHRHIAENHYSTKGGGWWDINKITKTILLYRESLEFGAAKREDLRQLVIAGMHDYPGYTFRHSYSGDLQEAIKNAVELK